MPAEESSANSSTSTAAARDGAERAVVRAALPAPAESLAEAAPRADRWTVRRERLVVVAAPPTPALTCESKPDRPLLRGARAWRRLQAGCAWRARCTAP